MHPPRGLLSRLADYFGAHEVPKRRDHEIERAGQRGWAALAILATWAFLSAAGEPPSRLRVGLMAFCALYSVMSFAHRRYVHTHPDGGVAAQYFFLVADPIVLVLVLFDDPEHFGFLNPFLLVVIVRCSIRYGTRVMWLAWGITCVCAAALLPLNPYWRRETELALSFALTLLFVPIFFPALIRRVHQVRLIEEERAQLKALHDGVKARNRFLARISHELRSPLQSILSAIDVLEMRHGHAIKEDEELIARMRRSSMLLNAQLGDLLTLARSQAGSLELRPEPLEVTSLVEGVRLATREAATEKGLRLGVKCPAEALFVIADGARIDQVITNLVANSIRYTDSGWVQITLHPYDVEREHLRFSISDSGAGIPTDRLQNLFEPDSFLISADRRGEGFGIGLAVVRTLVDRLGGKVSVETKVGHGTTFEVVIPAVRIDAGESAPADSSEDIASP